MSKQSKSMIDIMKSVRNTWNMNPRTRVQENELKSKKKRRQESKRLSRDEW